MQGNTMAGNIKAILKDVWGYDMFRPMQEDIINTVLRGGDCLALLPTGGGKSICFQVPALAKDGLCLVISPLIALMKDQVSNLRKRNITAFAIHTGMTRQEVRQTLQVAGNSNCKFLYVSPERLETNLFREYLLSLNISMIAVDEAHCISQWGYDFRPSYLKIAALREDLNNVPVLALTASATPAVQDDICDKLLFREKTVFRQSFERPNLSYSVFKVPSAINKIIDVLKKVQGTGIVYCRSRRRSREISELLNMHGIVADYYHAGLPQEERNARQEAWIQNKVRVIVCTNAFGMGIDKPDVRVVIHADVPDCLENYYQEAGRAGRDGKRCYAVLLYNQKQLNDLNSYISQKFPDLKKLREVYGSVMNYLQVPAGSGEGMYYEFDLGTFAKKFGQKQVEVINVLKTLAQEELLYFNEQVFVPSKVQVIAGRERLRELEKQNEKSDRLIKTLLRSYEGIMDQDTAINEKMVADLMKTPAEEIRGMLQNLHAASFIRYSPQKEKPQVYLPHNRVRAEDLHIDQKKYNSRRDQYADRVNQMMRFVTTTKECRSVVIGNYFGDPELVPCGICDNCINRKKSEVSTTEFEQLEQAILELVKRSPSTRKQIVDSIQRFPRNKTEEVLRFLQAEERVVAVNGKLIINER